VTAIMETNLDCRRALAGAALEAPGDDVHVVWSPVGSAEDQVEGARGEPAGDAPPIHQLAAARAASTVRLAPAAALKLLGLQMRPHGRDTAPGIRSQNALRRDLWEARKTGRLSS